MDENIATVTESGALLLSEGDQQRWGLRPGAQVLLRPTPQGLLLQPCDPPLATVYVEPTTACNLNCAMCMHRTWSEPTGFMDMALYKRLVAGLRAFAPRKVAFWGLGEPLLHPNIGEMVAAAGSLGATTELISNGLLLDEVMAETLLDAGLDTMVVSVDGPPLEGCYETKSGANQEAVQRNVRRLHALRRARDSDRPKVGLEFVVTEQNVAQLPNLRRLASSLGASFVVVSNLLPYSPEARDDIAYWLAVDARSNLGVEPDIRLPPIDSRLGFAGPLLDVVRQAGSLRLRPQGPMDPDPYCRFVGEGSFAVGWDGQVSPCVPLMHSYTCFVMGREKHIRRCTFGDLATQDVASIWRNPDFVAMRANVSAFGYAPCAECGGCELALSNEEDCYGNTFPVCGDCLWARGIIQCP